MIDMKMLEELSNADGISGYEKEVSRIVKKYFEKYANEIKYDNLGSIIGVKKGEKKGRKIMLSAHMDEVGFIVRGITDEGFIKLLPIGGWWGHVMPSQMMRVTTEAGDKIKGVVIGKAPHGMKKEEKEKVIEPQNFFLDLGVDNRDEVLNLGIKIGDMITPDINFSVMNNRNYFIGKAFDDRVGVSIIIEVLKRLEEEEINGELYIACTVQEEVGIRGARTAANLIKPDIAIAIDVTKSLDTPFEKRGIGLGKGVNITMVDALTIGNRELIEKIKNTCIKEDLDFNIDCMLEGGTDACNIHKSGIGVETAVVSVPTRYMHSSRLVIHKKDYLDTVEALVGLIKTLE